VSYHHLKSEVVGHFMENFAFLEKIDPLREDFQNFIPTGFIAHILCANFMKFSRLEIGKVVHYLPHQKTKFRLALVSVRIAPSGKQVPQISSKSVHFRQSYSRTREHSSNAPQSVSNTLQSYSFFADYS